LIILPKDFDMLLPLAVERARSFGEPNEANNNGVHFVIMSPVATEDGVQPEIWVSILVLSQV